MNLSADLFQFFEILSLLVVHGHFSHNGFNLEIQIVELFTVVAPKKACVYFINCFESNAISVLCNHVLSVVEQSCLVFNQINIGHFLRV